MYTHLHLHPSHTHIHMGAMQDLLNKKLQAIRDNEHDDIDLIPPYDKDKNAELIKMVVSFGIVDYPLHKILNIIPRDVDPVLFTQQFNDPTHPIHLAYIQGQDRRDYEIDTTLYNMVKGGDLEALEVFERRKRIRDNVD